MNIAYEHYAMIIQWSERDNADIVTVPELPGCRTHGKTYEDAVRQDQDAIETWIDSSQALGLPIPEPSVLLADTVYFLRFSSPSSTSTHPNNHSL